MNEVGFIGLVFIGVICFIIFVSMKERRRYRQMIQKRWGKDPSAYHSPNEEYLTEATYYLLSMMNRKDNVNSATWHDLDMFDVFKKINLTYSKYGEDMLYSSLKSVELDSPHHYIVVEEWQDYLGKNNDVREELQYQLNQLGKR
ncbi:hypothetical protein BW731_05835 [Vagococcus martis]|uniref:Uncharacterized protein n=1 Tax=Vagococcus martis TaxID=1768210 RepID=A0A1V4DGV7_9ENTE|nr:hypothetical protein [Vagococcus martis]OPF87735.1 hypothetical protein BW731_05835 [Vagococcus martis]